MMLIGKRIMVVNGRIGNFPISYLIITNDIHISNIFPSYTQSLPKNSRPEQSSNRINQKDTKRYHRVYPVFGKRSIADEFNSKHRRVRRDVEMDNVDKIHLRYHRSTRHDLYGRIEEYLQT